MKESTVKDADEGIRLDRWFKRHLPQVTHGILEKALRKGQVRLDGRKAEASARVQPGQVLRYPAEWLEQTQFAKPRKTYAPTEQEAKDLKARVLYKDEHCIVLNKPAGLAVQGGTKQPTSVDAMLDALKFDGERPKLVHRLDKDTSGCLVLARSAKAAAQLSKLFAGRDLEKMYVALVKGRPLPLKGTIRKALSKRVSGEDSRMQEAVEADDDGKPAITEYRVAEYLADSLSWVELKPVTGRTHQLRVHMAEIGHPIIGDGKYGGAEAFVRGLNISTQLHLHAERIVIPSLFGKRIEVRAPLPPHMKQSRKELGMD